jgi:hypothetical protein
MPAFLHAAWIDGTGPMPMIRGSTPLIAVSNPNKAS